MRLVPAGKMPAQLAQKAGHSQLARLVDRFRVQHRHHIICDPLLPEEALGSLAMMVLIPLVPLFAVPLGLSSVQRVKGLQQQHELDLHHALGLRKPSGSTA